MTSQQAQQEQRAAQSGSAEPPAAKVDAETPEQVRCLPVLVGSRAWPLLQPVQWDPWAQCSRLSHFPSKRIAAAGPRYCSAGPDQAQLAGVSALPCTQDSQVVAQPRSKLRRVQAAAREGPCWRVQRPCAGTGRSWPGVLPAGPRAAVQPGPPVIPGQGDALAGCGRRPGGFKRSRLRV